MQMGFLLKDLVLNSGCFSSLSSASEFVCFSIFYVYSVVVCYGLCDFGVCESGVCFILGTPSWS